MIDWLKSLDLWDVCLSVFSLACALLCVWMCFKIITLVIDVISAAPEMTIAAVTLTAGLRIYFLFKQKGQS